MKVVGFNFTKISVEKFEDKKNEGNVKIHTNIDIPEIKEMEPDFLKTKDVVLRVKFIFTVAYEPKLAKILLEGGLLFTSDPKNSKEILKEWEDKNMPEEFKLIIFNVIMRKSNIRALQLEEEVGLPLHVALPSLRKENVQSK